MMHITEDTPADMLAGAMDLSVHLPDGRTVQMAVERGTPMMDLLVHVTTAHKLRPSDHVIQPLDMCAGGQFDKVLPYMPNTPIGALDTQHIRVLGKGRQPCGPRHAAAGHQPFENTFRLQVHLPRNQFIVIRVGRHVLLEDIMKRVCAEKNLDPKKYEFRHPANVDKVLDPRRTLNDYELTEITVVARGSYRLQPAISNSDIMVLQREEERRKFQPKTGGGVLNLIFRKGRSSTGSGSVSSDTRSISPTQSDDSRSVTPPAVQPKLVPKAEVPKSPARPKPPLRKRRPAPKPPSQPVTPEAQQERVPAKENGLTICHSRNSSDSSGYHEASILSDNCTLPRKPKLSAELFKKSEGNLTSMAAQSKSTTSLVNAGRKKKAPPPPPGLKTAASMANINISLVASAVEMAQKPPDYPTPITRSSPSSSDCPPLPKPRVKSLPVAPPEPRADDGFGGSRRRLLSKTLSSLAEPSTGGGACEPDADMQIDMDMFERDTRDERLPLTGPRSSDSTPASTEVPNFRKWDDVRSLDGASDVSDDDTNAPAWVDGNSCEPDPACANEPARTRSTPPPTPDDCPGKMSRRNSVESTEPELQTSVSPVDTQPATDALTERIQSDDLEEEWQYQLPSPPRAFRDSSPTNFTDYTSFDTITFNGLSDASAASATLLEKLESIRNKRSASESASESDAESAEKPTILTPKYMSIENLEKRRSLVLERELASLKIAQNDAPPANNSSSPKMRRAQSKIISDIEGLKGARTLKPLSRSNSQTREKLLQVADSTLPNFKISTYDQPKSKINIFEDDSIRSNEKRSSTENIFSQNRNSYASSDVFKKPQTPRPKIHSSVTNIVDKSDTVSRSESFTTKNVWTRANPVKRSKSQISLERYKDETKVEESAKESIHKTNSLWNVSGLQSLEVMRMILPKLGSTPPNTPTEEAPQTKHVAEPKSRYIPPAVNLCSWSDRPKSQVALKEDKDYKISSMNAAKLKFSSQTNVSQELKRRESLNYSAASAKANGDERKTDSGNVVIKIGSAEPKGLKDNSFYSRFLMQTTATGYRKPLASVNGVDKPRPHSIAFDASCPDLSRVPIVRAVELKKPYKDNQSLNKSITQICPDSDYKLGIPEAVFNASSKRYEAPKCGTLGTNYRSAYPEARTPGHAKPVQRGQSFAFGRTNAPVVKGFKIDESWANARNARPVKIENANAYKLQTVESRNRINQSKCAVAVPPPPMPKVTAVTKKLPPVQLDPRDQLLESIRSFGGRSGLRAAK